MNWRRKPRVNLKHSLVSPSTSRDLRFIVTTLMDYQHARKEVFIMESVELKLREINNSRFVIAHTKHIIDILHEPKLAIEVKAGQISEDVSQLVESLGYQIVSNRPMDGWNRLTAVKQD
jgi:hypothetical protein